mmetsp:Transcript_17366/g.16576  ORF Transcript_17366/g.16576 Transcript_17366/m.16576 type:complete len:190 (-) Transcript_17366:71-640(-)
MEELQLPIQTFKLLLDFIDLACDFDLLSSDPLLLSLYHWVLLLLLFLPFGLRRGLAFVFLFFFSFTESFLLFLFLPFLLFLPQPLCLFFLFLLLLLFFLLLLLFGLLLFFGLLWRGSLFLAFVPVFLSEAGLGLFFDRRSLLLGRIQLLHPFLQGLFFLLQIRDLLTEKLLSFLHIFEHVFVATILDGV